MSLRHCGVALWWFVYICCAAFPVFTCCVLICFTIDLVGRILTGWSTARMVGMVSPRASTRHDQSRTGPVQHPCRGQVEVMHYRTQLLIRLTLLTLLHKGRFESLIRGRDRLPSGRLMAARKEYGITTPFKDMNISGSLHTPQAFSDQGEHVQRFSCGDMCV